MSEDEQARCVKALAAYLAEKHKQSSLYWDGGQIDGVIDLAEIVRVVLAAASAAAPEPRYNPPTPPAPPL